ncbi:MAG: hypothetical protein AAB838_02035, partial [Patescibacteria group bacterium]
PLLAGYWGVDTAYKNLLCGALSPLQIGGGMVGGKNNPDYLNWRRECANFLRENTLVSIGENPLISNPLANLPGRSVSAPVQEKYTQFINSVVINGFYINQGCGFQQALYDVDNIPFLGDAVIKRFIVLPSPKTYIYNIATGKYGAPVDCPK